MNWNLEVLMLFEKADAKKRCKLRLSALLLEDGVDEFKGLFESNWNLQNQSEASSNAESFKDNIPDKQLFCVQ